MSLKYHLAKSFLASKLVVVWYYSITSTCNGFRTSTNFLASCRLS